MTPKPVAVAAPFQWLIRTLDIGRRNPRALFGALAIAIVVIMAISVLQLGLQTALLTQPSLLLAAYVFTTAIGWVVMPPLLGGVFRVVDATDRGAPVRAGDVLAPFSDPPLARKLVLTSLAYMLAYLLLFALLMLTPAGTFFRDYLAIALATPPGGEPDQAAIVALISGIAPGTLPIMLAFALVMVVWSHAYMFALATAALAPAGVGESIRAGLAATMRNVLPLFLFTIVAGFAALLVGFIVMLVAVLVATLLALVSPVLAMLFAVPVFFAALIATYALMFGFYHQGWREIFADAPAAPTAPGAIVV